MSQFPRGAGEGSLKIYLREISRTPILTREQERELSMRIRDGDHEARDLMIRSNLRLVVKIAFEHINRGLPLVDLISEGNLGLLTAVEKYDPSRQSRLSTYACWWIKQSIHRALSTQTRTIRLPSHVSELLSKMRHVAAHMSYELGRPPTDEELADELGLSYSRVAKMRSASVSTASLDAPLSGDGSLELGELICDSEAPTPFDQARDRNQTDALAQVMTVLNERERTIICARFGIGGVEEKTLAQLGEEIGRTRERVRQLEEIALRKLRRALRKRESFPKNGEPAAA